MAYFSLYDIGNRMAYYRKKAGLTQSEAAERVGLSDHGYAEIERGTTNMRVGTLINICKSFDITPNDLLVMDMETPTLSSDAILEILNSCSEKERLTALKLLTVYLESH